MTCLSLELSLNSTNPKVKLGILPARGILGSAALPTDLQVTRITPGLPSWKRFILR